MKRQSTFWVLLFVSILVHSSPVHCREIPYGTGRWDAKAYGNHRAVVLVSVAADAVCVRVPWRRRDTHPRSKILVVDGATNRRVSNVYRGPVNREFADVVFQPPSGPGEYYVYYLVNEMIGRSNYPTVVYPKSNETAEPRWLEKHGLPKKPFAKDALQDLPRAQVTQFQAIDEFHSFYPMEVVATADEVAALLNKHEDALYLLFPEDRRYPIRMTEDLPRRWIKSGPQSMFQDRAGRGEYYAFQIGVFACRSVVENLAVQFGDLKSVDGDETIPATQFTCFNTGGSDCTGKRFEKRCSVPKGKVQALWCGVQIPPTARPGEYVALVTVKPEKLASRQIELQVTVSQEVLSDAGDSEPWRHSRLRWLNSRLALDDEVVAPYTPLTVENNAIRCLGRKVTLGTSGLPERIQSYFAPEMTRLQKSPREVLAGPIELIITDGEGKAWSWREQQMAFSEQTAGKVAWESRGRAGPISLKCEGRMEFDGCLDFVVKLKAEETTSLGDIRLEVPLLKSAAKYILGMGVKGGHRPSTLQWKWDQKKNQDSVWLGDVNAGLRVSFRDERYERPLNTNFYLRKPLVMPRSWCNDGRGGCDLIEVGEDRVLIRAYSGPRTIAAGEKLYFNFSLSVTPFRPINPKRQWATRYYHRYKPLDEIAATGANTINVHHATEINPFINYPFLQPRAMKAYIDAAHARDMKVKIYYTVRELSNRAPELFALRSLGDEIFFPGEGGGFSWLQEHLDSDYIAAWYVPKLEDAAIINSGVSRWHNYYVEGLDWLAQNVEIDGLYIDDVAFDRTTMKRVRKVLDRNRPGALIDLHSANQFNVRDGYANSANLYMEHFPYIDRLWFGEYFDYDSPPEFWLTEISGIPFGLMGEMLQDGGNPWRGMLFGMTSRLPWAGDPTGLWKLWDDFEIQNAEMYGFWAPSCPIKTDHPDVLVTAYVKPREVLIAIASWVGEDVQVQLQVDWGALGLDPDQAVLEAPFIKDFQEQARFRPGDPITVKTGRGWLLSCSARDGQ